MSLIGALHATGGAGGTGPRNNGDGGGGGRVLILTADGTLESGTLDANVNVGNGVKELKATEPLAITDFYLHGTGPNNNPPTLFVNPTPPTTTTEKFRDSMAVKFSGGNPWKEIGTWTSPPAQASVTMTELSDLHVWLGLKNSDDQGTRFDLRGELYKNSTLVTAGETYCIEGITRNPDLAKEVTLTFAPFPPAVVNTSEQLRLRNLDPDREQWGWRLLRRSHECGRVAIVF